MECAGTDRAMSAGDPDWFAQADEQMAALLETIVQIDDPSCREAWEHLEMAFVQARRIKEPNQ